MLRNANSSLTAISRPAFRLRGSLEAPGDKSISHRALMLGALAEGNSTITGLLESDDVLATKEAMCALGARIVRKNPGVWSITGTAGKLTTPKKALDFGNAGTGLRLGLGLVAGHGIAARFTGDASLQERPMKRVLQPLKSMGAKITANNGKLPIELKGPKNPLPVSHQLQIASAQVKSAILLAGLRANGQTCVTEPVLSRDHTERMLCSFGAKVTSTYKAETAHEVKLHGPCTLRACDVTVPGDPSSAAFAVLAALLVPDSQVSIKNVLLNPGRDGFFLSLQEAGYDLQISNHRQSGGETIVNLQANAGVNTPLAPPAGRAASMIDEYPALFVLAAFAKGISRFDGIGELRVKESDRISAMGRLLRSCGVQMNSGENWVEIHGQPALLRAPQYPFVANGDHRIAMCALIIGAAGFLPLTLEGAETIATSYPGFFTDMQNLGANMELIE